MVLFRKRDSHVDEFPESDAAREHRLELTRNFTIELVPMKSLDEARRHVPAQSTISLTCSPVKGIAETQRLTEELLAEGHSPIPHIAARMVRDRAHTQELAAWCRSTGVSKVFLVGGDADPPGGYFDAVEFLRDFLDTDHGLEAIGVTAYPDHHAYISDGNLHAALHAKQTMLAEAGIAGWCSTQMCFDAEVLEAWMRAQRAAGLTLPIHLGISGVVDKTKLLSTGMRIGLGQSLGYLKKNRAAIAKMMTSADYDPNDLLLPLSEANLELGVTGVHMYTFNQVEATEAWRADTLAC